MGPKLSRILVILWLLRQEFAQKEIGWFKYQLISILLSQKSIISRRDATERLCLPKINAKMPTRTKYPEMNKIVSNSEIHLHHCLCESRGFKIGKNNHRRCSVKKVLLKVFQHWQKRTCVRVRHRVSTVSFTKFLRALFLQSTSGRLLLMKKLGDQKF